MATATATRRRKTKSLEELRQAAASRYGELIPKLSRGESIPEGSLTDALLARGKNYDDVSADVSEYEQRLAWLAEYQKDPELNAQLKPKIAEGNNLREKIAGLQKQIEQTQAEFYKVEDEKRRLVSQRAECGKAKANLQRTASKAIVDRLGELTRELTQQTTIERRPASLKRELVNPRDGQRRLGRFAELDKQRIAMDQSGGYDKHQLRAEPWEIQAYENKRREIAQAEADAEQARQRIAALQAEQEKLAAQQLKPENGSFCD